MKENNEEKTISNPNPTLSRKVDFEVSIQTLNIKFVCLDDILFLSK
jgi:hypothetical protein